MGRSIRTLSKPARRIAKKMVSRKSHKVASPYVLAPRTPEGWARFNKALKAFRALREQCL